MSTQFRDLLEQVTAADVQTVPDRLDNGPERLIRNEETQETGIPETQIDDIDEILDSLVSVVMEIFNGTPSQIHEYCQKLLEAYPDLYDECAENDFFTKEDLIEIIIDLLEEGEDEEDILDEMGAPDTDNQYDETLFDTVLNYLALSGFNLNQDVYDVEDEDEEVNEAGIKPRFTTGQYNRKRRKFMKKSISNLRRTKVQRKQDNRKNRTVRRRYYRQNKQKIKRYMQQYRKAVNTGKHKVKIRRRT